MRAVHPGAIVVSPATVADLDVIDEISRHSFKTPWPRKTFEEELSRAHARLDLARRGGDVLGYLNYWLVADEVHLLAIATHPDARRGGIGYALMRHLVDGARERNARLVTLEVRAGNEAALALYRRFGFEEIAKRRGYYGDDDEDAVVMTLELTAS
jgi:[ribosomal protein S18]-alanine N-acetyltransferase